MSKDLGKIGLNQFFSKELEPFIFKVFDIRDEQYFLILRHELDGMG